MSCSYWAPSQDAAVAECRAELVLDDAIRRQVWKLYQVTPPPLGFDPGGINVPGWDTPTSPRFACAWRLKALRGEDFLQSGSGAALVWRGDARLASS